MDYSFYGGKQGSPFNIEKVYYDGPNGLTAYMNMVKDFKLGTGCPVSFGGYVILQSSDPNENAKLYRRGIDYNSSTGGADFICHLNGPKGEAGVNGKTPIVTVEPFDEIRDVDDSVSQAGVYSEIAVAPVPGFVKGEDGTEDVNNSTILINAHNNYDSFEDTTDVKLGFKVPYPVFDFDVDPQVFVITGEDVKDTEKLKEKIQQQLTVTSKDVDNNPYHQNVSLKLPVVNTIGMDDIDYDSDTNSLRFKYLSYLQDEDGDGAPDIKTTEVKLPVYPNGFFYNSVIVDAEDDDICVDKDGNEEIIDNKPVTKRVKKIYDFFGRDNADKYLKLLDAENSLDYRRDNKIYYKSEHSYKYPLYVSENGTYVPFTKTIENNITSINGGEWPSNIPLFYKKQDENNIDVYIQFTENDSYTFNDENNGIGIITEYTVGAIGPLTSTYSYEDYDENNIIDKITLLTDDPSNPIELDLNQCIYEPDNNTDDSQETSYYGNYDAENEKRTFVFNSRLKTSGENDDQVPVNSFQFSIDSIPLVERNSTGELYIENSNMPLNLENGSIGLMLGGSLNDNLHTFTIVPKAYLYRIVNTESDYGEDYDITTYNLPTVSLNGERYTVKSYPQNNESSNVFANTVTVDNVQYTKAEAELSNEFIYDGAWNNGDQDSEGNVSGGGNILDLIPNYKETKLIDNIKFINQYDLTKDHELQWAYYYTFSDVNNQEYTLTNECVIEGVPTQNQLDDINDENPEEGFVYKTYPILEDTEYNLISVKYPFSPTAIWKNQNMERYIMDKYFSAQNIDLFTKVKDQYILHDAELDSKNVTYELKDNNELGKYKYRNVVKMHSHQQLSEIAINTPWADYLLTPGVEKKPVLINTNSLNYTQTDDEENNKISYNILNGLFDFILDREEDSVEISKNIPMLGEEEYWTISSNVKASYDKDAEYAIDSITWDDGSLNIVFIKIMSDEIINPDEAGE